MPRRPITSASIVPTALAALAVAATSIIGLVVAAADSTITDVVETPAPNVAPATRFDPLPGDSGWPAGLVHFLPRGFIEAIDAPVMVAAAELSWADDTDVIGLAIDGDARAYPISVLLRHEMVADEVGGTPVLVTWCPVCGTAMAHRRTIDGAAAPSSFGVQGALWRNAMTWFDHETGSIWSQAFGRAIAGPLTGSTVDLLPAQLTTWGAWRDIHPHTLALDASAKGTGVDLTDLLVVVEIDGDVGGYPVSAVRRAGAANDVLGGRPVAVVIDPSNADRWAVFSRELAVADETIVVELALRADQIVDTASGSVFDPVTGWAVAGPLAGARLERLPALTSIGGFGPTRTPIFATLWPDGRIWWP